MNMHNTSLATLPLQTLCAACRCERQHGDSETSPACVELFRRAFAGDEQAWASASALFEPLMRHWIGVQSYVEIEDVLQEALLLFWRFAPQRPTLVLPDDLRPLLVYLRKTTKTALLKQLHNLPSGWQTAQQASPVCDDKHATGGAFEAEVELRLLLEDSARRLLQTPAEHLIFQLHFGAALPPREILVQHGHLFADIANINTIIQRLTRRFRALLRPQVTK
jgi:DNA-directed RNA polymerase specialized sigma24 family protein